MRFLAVVPLLVALAPPASAAAAPGTDLTHALEVLHAWDGRRADAWAADDRAGLRALYVRGSLAGRADVRLLEAYADRGLVVRRLVTQVFFVRVLRRDAQVIRLRVVDRVAGGTVVHAGHEVPLRSSRPVARTVTLRLVRGSWLVAGVTDSGTGLRGARR